MNRFLCCLALLCFHSALPQTNNNVLTIGNPVPDMMITGIINHPTGQARISDYKGQLLILDFWATWCAPCITMLPKSDSLNKVFKGKAQILPVTYQSKEEVSKLFRNKSSLRHTVMPIATSDKVLHDAFPHQELPHYVWIDTQGIVKAITGYREVTAANISTMLSPAVADRKVLPVKSDAFAPYDRNLPLLFNSVNFTSEDLHYETLFTRYNPSLHSRFDILRYPDNSYARFSSTNMSLFNLFGIAHTYNNVRLQQTRIISELKDPFALQCADWDTRTTEEQTAWMQQNAWCYELIVPPSLSSEFFSFMRQDLARIFPQYKATMQSRPAECLVLVRTSASDKIKTSGAKPASRFDQTEISIVNGSLTLLINRLTGGSLQYLQTPLVDDTGYTGNIDISLTGDVADVDFLRKALSKYDLDLVPRKMNIEMLVISDSN